VFNHDRADPARSGVQFALHGDPGDHVLKANRPGLFGKNRHIMGIPLSEGCSRFDGIAIPDAEHSSSGDVIVFELLLLVVEDADLTGLVQNNQRSAIVHFNNPQAVKLHTTGIAHLDLRGLGERR